MNTLRDAAQQALKTLKWHLERGVWGADIEGATAALETALAESQPEPVAWMVYTEDGASAYVTDNPNDLVGAYRALPLYTTPPQLQPLTGEEIIAVLGHVRSQLTGNVFLDFARALEKAHGIGGAT